MPKMQIISGIAGKGTAEYETGTLTLPNGVVWFAEQVSAVTVHGGVDEQGRWSDRVLGALKGGLALASNLDLSPALSLAASAVGAGVGAMSDAPKQNVVIEVELFDASSIIAMAAPGLAALILNDRDVCRKAAGRLRDAVTTVESDPAPRLIDQSRQAIGQAVGQAVNALPSLGRLWPRSGSEKK